jgi:hypothetical protein
LPQLAPGGTGLLGSLLFLSAIKSVLDMKNITGYSCSMSTGKACYYKKIFAGILGLSETMRKEP